MIVVTGGAGFIGSALVWALNKRGIEDIIVVDMLEQTEKWRNLVPLRFSEYMDSADFIEKLENNYFDKSIEAILHLGACTSTTETNNDFLIENNYRYTVRLGLWREAHPWCRFIYASSAATYGSGDAGYLDNQDDLHTLRALNMYGYSKHLFDIYAQKKGWLSSIVGLKYFNVFGPNEYHKGDMRSVICKAYPDVHDKGTMTLFKSHKKGYRHGDQKRDFIYVKDAVAMTLFFLDKTDKNGIYNIGTGKAHTWNEVATALFSAAKRKKTIQYVPMPSALREKYQYFTCADIQKLRHAGCVHPCMKLEDAIRDYVTQYLAKGAYLGSEKILV